MKNEQDPQGPQGYSPALAGPGSGDVIYDENGIDRSLIRWMLSLAPEQRLQVLQDALSLMPMKSDRAR